MNIPKIEMDPDIPLIDLIRFADAQGCVLRPTSNGNIKFVRERPASRTQIITTGER